MMLGCGEIGRLLLEKDSRFTVVAVEGEELEKEGYCAVKGDPADVNVLEKVGIERADVIVIVEDLKVLEQARKLNSKAFLVVCRESRKRKRKRKIERKIERTETEKDAQEYKGADFVVPSTTAAADECLYQIQMYENLKRKEALEEVLRSGKSLAIIMHDNPDPDCISSALALKVIAERMGVVADLFYGGQIGYSENQVLVDLLDLALIPPDQEPDFEKYDLTAFVDHSPWDYTSIAKHVNPDIVVDHHLKPDYEGRFVDVREDVGSTSTILVEYLQLFRMTIGSKLATGLFYGLLVDTDSFRRGISAEDIEALKILKDKVDTELLSRVERGAIPRGLKGRQKDADFLSVLGEAVKNMQARENVVFSYVGKVKYRDAVSNSADYLLKMEKVDVVFVYGILRDSLYISGRSVDKTLHVGKLLREAFRDLGRAGGRPLIGGATIPLEKLPEDFENEIVNRVLQVVSHS